MIRLLILILSLLTPILVGSCKKEFLNLRSGKHSGDVIPAPCLRIRGGEVIQANTPEAERYRSSGQLQYKDKSGGFRAFCSGNLIAPNVVLTARHCVEPPSSDDYPATLKPIESASNRKFDLQDGSGAKTVKKIIGWDDRERFRDVALVFLDNAYSEMIPVYRLAAQPVLLPLNQALADSPLMMVGSGGYADGFSSASYDYGKKRKGKAIYAGYNYSDHFTKKSVREDTNCNPANDTNCIDYMSLVSVIGAGPDYNPDPAKPMICGGDSGSSMFWTAANSNLVVGVTSLGGSKNRDTSATDCNTSMYALFVPSYSIADWVAKKVSEETAQPLMPATSLVTGKITKVDPKNGFSTVSVDSVKIIDDAVGLIPADVTNDKKERSSDGLSVPTRVATLTFDVCMTDCPPSLVATSLDVGKEIKFRVAKMLSGTEIRLAATFVTLKLAAYRYPVEFIAKVVEDPAAKGARFGRDEQLLKLGNIRPISGEVPSFSSEAQGLVCSGGVCSQVTEVAADVEIKAGKDVHLFAEFVEDQGLFLRKIAFAEPAPTPTDNPCN